MSDSRDDFIIAIRYSLLKKGTKQKFSLFFLIIFSIFIIVLDKLTIPPIGFIKTTLKDVVYRVTVVASSPGKFILYTGSKAKEHFNIYDENRVLREEIEVLKKNEFDNSFLKTENKNLKMALGLEAIQDTEEGSATVAKVIIDQESPFLKSIIINKGTKHNISKGMTVFSKKYLIGTVIESNYLSSRVLLITDLNSKIPTIIEDSDINIILTGNGNKNDFTLEYLPDDYQLQPNKIIFTSGKGGFLKTGMPVAETYLNKKNEVKVKSLTDPQQASIVRVTKGQFRN